MRLLVTGGGTAGGVYPALSVIDELLRDDRWATRIEDVAWVGSASGLERRIVTQRGISFHVVETGPLRGANPIVAAKSVWALGKGTLAARRIVGQFRPDAILATGGYVSVPLTVGAYRRCPVLMYLPDAEPGLAVRFLAPLATRIAVSFEGVHHLPQHKTFVSGYPVRRALFELDRDSGRRILGLNQEFPVVLIMGGSQGASTINGAVSDCLEALLDLAQVVHISGNGEYDRLCARRAGLPLELASRYRLFNYLHDEMPAALVGADLVVARAGAATLAEFPATGLPAVVVPYAYSGNHQQANAEYLSQRGAAVVIDDVRIREELFPTVEAVLRDEGRRKSMAAAMQSLAAPDAAAAIAEALKEMVA